MNGAPNLPVRIRVGVPMSPMHTPIVGVLLCRVSSNIRRLSWGWLAIVEFHDVRVELAQPAVDFREIVGRLAEIVEADDPFRAAEAGDGCGQIILQVDVLHPFRNRRPQQQRPLLLAAGELAAVGRPPAGDDHRARPVRHQPPEVDFSVEVVQPQLDQAGALIDQVPILRDHVPMPAAANAYADHGNDE